MKIEGNRPNLESVAAQRTDRINLEPGQARPAGTASAQGTDRVQVSEDAALAATHDARRTKPRTSGRTWSNGCGRSWRRVRLARMPSDWPIG